MKQNKYVLGILALVAVQILSGINNPIIRFALESMPVYLFGFLRVGIALVVIGPIALWLRSKRSVKKKAIRPSDMLMIIAGSLLIYCGANLAFYAGIQHSTSINAAIISLLGPILFFLATIEVLKERFNKKIFLGILLAFVGAMIIVLGPLMGHADATQASLLGNSLLVVSVIADVGGTILLKKVLKRTHPLDVLAIGLVVATICYGIMAMPHIDKLSLLADPAIRNAVLYGALMVGCIAYALNFYGLKVTKGSDVSIIGYLQPVVTTVVAIKFFNESFTPSLMIGGAIVFAGLYLVEARNLLHFHGLHVHK